MIMIAWHEDEIAGLRAEVARLRALLKGTVQQYAGRLTREHAGKTNVRIIDFVDTSYPALLKMWEKRKKTYKALGYRVTENG